MTDLDGQAGAAVQSTVAPDSLTGPAVENSNQPRRWSAGTAFVMSLWRPATTASRLQHISLRKAYGIHITAAVLTAALVVILVAADSVRAPFSATDVLGESLRLIEDDALDEFVRHPYQTSLVSLGVVLAIEIGFLMLALLILPWGAVDEPFRDSLRNALRWTWLHTTHALPIVLFVGVEVVSLNQMNRSFRARHAGTMPSMPTAPRQAKPGSAEWNEFQRATQACRVEYSKWWRKVEAQRPWFLKNQDFFIAATCVLSTLWVLWTLLRGVGAKRHIVYRPRPPTCESCGYNLTTMPMEGRCPECGEAVELSLGSDVRRGAPWARRKDIGTLNAWWQTTALVFSQPKMFGRAIALRPVGRDHRRFFAWHLPLFFFLGGFGFFAAVVVVRRNLPFLDQLLNVLAIVSLIGIVAALVAMGVCLLVASLVGAWFQWTDKRNLSVSAIQVTSYLAGVFAIWMALAVVWLGVVIWMNEQRVFRELEGVTNIDDDVLTFFAWLIPNIIVAVFYVSIAARAVAGTRYANK